MSRGEFKELKSPPINKEYYSKTGDLDIYKHPHLNITYAYDTISGIWYRYYPE